LYFDFQLLAGDNCFYFSLKEIGFLFEMVWVLHKEWFFLTNPLMFLALYCNYLVQDSQISGFLGLLLSRKYLCTVWLSSEVLNFFNVKIDALVDS